MRPDDTFLRSYMERIAYNGPIAPDLATLNALNLAHTAAIPFENIASFLGDPPRLDLETLCAKLIDAGRGGYCFEQNSLFHAVLTKIGFAATPLAGRVVWMQPPDRAPSARSHMLLKVETAEGPHIVDVGFGGHIMTAPLRLRPGEIQPTPTGPQRIGGGDGLYTVEVELPSGWQPTYQFSLEPYLPVDFEPLNWFIATHSSSIFTANLMLERATPDVRYSLFNDAVTVRRRGLAPETRRLSNLADFTEMLSTRFRLPSELPYAEMFERLPKGLDGPAFRPAADRLALA